MSNNHSLFGQERWTATELGEALCLSVQRINQLVKDGILPNAIDGRYLPRDAVAAYVRHLRQHEARLSQAGELARKVVLENQIRTIKLQRIAGELIPVDRVQKDWFEISRRVRDALMNLPSRLSGPFAAELDQTKIFAMLEKEIRQTLEELARAPAPPTPATDLPIQDWLPRDEPAGGPEVSAQEDAEVDNTQADRFATGD